MFAVLSIVIIQYCGQSWSSHLERHEEGGPGAHNAEGTDRAWLFVTLLIKVTNIKLIIWFGESFGAITKSYCHEYWILLKVTCNYWWLLIWEEPWYEVGEYVSGRPPAQLHHKPGQTVLRHKRLNQIWDLLKKLWDLVFKEVRGILRFPNSIPPSHYKRLNCTWSTISTWEVMEGLKSSRRTSWGRWWTLMS